MADLGGAIKVEYWAVRKGVELYDFEGATEFRAELEQNYISQVHARPGPLGGLYSLVVEFLTKFTLHHFLDLIVDGIAYDLVKSGSNALVLRPFLAAYHALKKRNSDHHHVYIDRLVLSFQDCILTIHSLRDDSIVRNLEPILKTLATNYSHLVLRTGERPFSITIPVVEDPASDRLCRFREVLDFDETIENIPDDLYFGLWGIQYDYSESWRVFDVKNQLLLDEEFYTRSRYWREWEDRRRRRPIK